MNDSEKKKRLKQLLKRKPQKILKPKLPRSTSIKTVDLSGSTKIKRKKPKPHEPIELPLIKAHLTVPKKFDYSNPVVRVAVMSSFGPKSHPSFIKGIHEHEMWKIRSMPKGITLEEYQKLQRDKANLPKDSAKKRPWSMTAKKAHQFGKNLGFGAKQYIEKYGANWQIQLAREIRNVEGEAYHKAKTTVMFREAVAFTNWYFKNKEKYDNRRDFSFEYKILYGRRLVSVADLDVITTQLRRLIEYHPYNEYELTKMLKVREKQARLPAYMIAILNNGIADVAKRSKYLWGVFEHTKNTKNNMEKLINELWMETALHMRELHKASLAKIPELKEMEKREFLESYTGDLSYEEFKESVYEDIDNDKEINLNPKNLVSMAYSKKFEDEFMPKLIAKYGEKPARDYYLSKIVEGQATFMRLTAEDKLKDKSDTKRKLVKRYRNWKHFLDALYALEDHFKLMNPEDRAEGPMTPLDKRFYLGNDAQEEGFRQLLFPVNKRKLHKKLKAIANRSKEEQAIAKELFEQNLKKDKDLKETFKKIESWIKD